MLFDQFDFKANSEGFSPAMAAMLIIVDGELYTSIFKEHNLGVSDLSDLTDLDLIMLGVDDALTREKIMNAVDHLPPELRSNRADPTPKSSNIMNILNDNINHLHKISVSLMANRISLVKSKNVEDILLPVSSEYYATDLIVHTVKEMERILNNIEFNIQKINVIELTQKKKKRRSKKVVSIVGGIVIAALSVGFIKSIRQLL